MNRTTSLSAPSLAAILVGAATLPGSAVASAPPSFYATLPAGRLGVPEQLDVPDSIPATEHAEGVYAEIPDYVKNNPNPSSRYAQVFGSKEDAEAYNNGTGERSGSCVAVANPGNAVGGTIRWNGGMSASTSVSAYTRSYSYGPDGATPKDYVTVAPIRVDRVTKVTEDSLTLETKIALLDVATLGSRLVQTTTMDFKHIRTLPGRMHVYGAKDGDAVTFLVRHELAEGERSFSTLFGTLGDFQSISASDNCPVTFSLPVRQASASTIVLQLEAVLEVKNASVEDFNFGESDPPPSFESATPREARMRPMQIGFSSSWLSQDQAPVVSISHGWTGKERIQPM